MEQQGLKGRKNNIKNLLTILDGLYNTQENNGVKHLVTLCDGSTTLEKIVNGVKHYIALRDGCTTQEQMVNDVKFQSNFS